MTAFFVLFLLIAYKLSLQFVLICVMKFCFYYLGCFMGSFLTFLSLLLLFGLSPLKKNRTEVEGRSLRVYGVYVSTKFKIYITFRNQRFLQAIP